MWLEILFGFLLGFLVGWLVNEAQMHYWGEQGKKLRDKWEGH